MIQRRDARVHTLVPSRFIYWIRIGILTPYSSVPAGRQGSVENFEIVWYKDSIFLGSSAVERRPVKAMVVGSIPTRGADSITWDFLG